MGITIDGLILRALRREQLWSQAELAARSCAFARAEGDRQCGITRETVSKLECGQRTPSPRTLRYIIGALRPGTDDLRRLLGQEPPRVLADLTGDGWKEDIMDRRELLLAGLAAAVSPLDVSERITRALGRPGQIDDELLGALLGQSRRLGNGAVGVAPALLAGAANRHLTTIQRLHSYTLTPDRRRQLRGIAADSAALVSWLAWLREQPVQADDAMKLARRLVHDAENPLLQARILGLASWMASTIPSGGQRGDTATALALAQEARAFGRHAPPADQVWLAEREAIQLAASGDGPACWRTLAEADRDAVVEPPDGGFFASYLQSRGDAHALGVTGLCHLLLGEARQAEKALSQALEILDPSDVRYASVLLCDLTDAYVQQEDAEAASRVATQAVELATLGGHALNVQRVRGVRERMPQSWASHPLIRDLDERFHMVT